MRVVCTLTGGIMACLDEYDSKILFITKQGKSMTMSIDDLEQLLPILKRASAMHQQDALASQLMSDPGRKKVDDFIARRKREFDEATRLNAGFRLGIGDGG